MNGDLDDEQRALPGLRGALVLGALVTGVVMILPILVLVMAAQIVREARAR